MTWQHGSIMGGFLSVVCSFDTGQTKIEWNRYDGGSGVSTGNSFSEVHSVRFCFWMVWSFMSVGRAIAPAVAATYSGESADSSSKEQNSRVKEVATSSQAVELMNLVLYGDSSRFEQNGIAPINCCISSMYRPRKD